MRTASIASALIFGATLCAAAAMQQSDVAFVDVTVIPMDSERVLDHHTVAVNKGTHRVDRPRRKGRGRYCRPSRWEG